MALSRAHDVLTRENWDSARLRDIALQAMLPYDRSSGERVTISGPDVRLPPRITLSLSMALHELATNAVKYGALSEEQGQVAISWTLRNEAELQLRWQEMGGPIVRPPARRGFGTRLIEQSLAQELNGQVSLDFAPRGLSCTIAARLCI